MMLPPEPSSVPGLPWGHEDLVLNRMHISMLLLLWALLREPQALAAAGLQLRMLT